MFSYPNVFVMIFAVLLGMAFIVLCVYYVNKLFVNQTKDILVRFILLVFASLVGVFVVDKVIAFKINLLSDEQNNQLFDLIKTLTLMIFSYYFGSQRGVDNKNNKDEHK
jgi:hypothetical protein